MDGRTCYDVWKVWNPRKLILGFRLSSDASLSVIENWRSLKHPSIVGVKEAFTTKAFGDNCILLSDFIFSIDCCLQLSSFIKDDVIDVSSIDNKCPNEGKDTLDIYLANLLCYKECAFIIACITII